jgi:hypothetical protein
MRKLTVKNFSVIKEAELEFGKITVLIGPQSSGKSLLCKLAYFLSREVSDIAVARIKNRFDFAGFEIAVKKEFAEWFPRGGWGNKNWSAKFVSGSYEISIFGLGDVSPEPSQLSLQFGQSFKDLYEEQRNHKGPWTEAIPHLIFRNLMGKGFWDQATFIPSERSYFVDTQKGYRLLETQPDPIASRFAVLYSDSLSPEIPKPRLRDHLKGELKRGEDSWLFVFDDGRVLPLSHLSSGSKEMLPLLSALEMYAYRRPSTINDVQTGVYPSNYFSDDEFFIEEPEANIFPATQYELVRDFAELGNKKDLRPRFVITTHSPYILSAFNNLVEAGQVARNRPELSEQVAKIIPERYWIKEGEFKAYAIEDGKLESILNESGFVEGNYLDQVSETISDEFDRLIKLEYDHAKAS